MNKWNIRLVLHAPEEDGSDFIHELREVYYDADGKPWGHNQISLSTESLDPRGAPEELTVTLKRCARALDKPILCDPQDFVGRPPDYDEIGEEAADDFIPL